MLHTGGRGFHALELVPVTPKLGQYFGTDKGLLVVRAPPAPGAGLEEGDVILTIGGRTPRILGMPSASSGRTSRERRSRSKCCASASG